MNLCGLYFRLGYRSMIDDTSYLGTRTSGLDLSCPVNLSQDDRRRHLYIIGKTGTGKTTLILSLILADLAAGRGLALLDPHGDLAKAVIDAMPHHRIPDCIYLNPADLEFPCGINPLFNVEPDRRPLVAANIVATFRHIWADSWGPRLEYLLQNSLRLLLDGNGSTLLGLPALLVNDRYRERLLLACRDAQVRQFWTHEIVAWGDQFKAEALSPLQNKIGALLAPPVLRNILGQHQPTIDIAAIMNSNRILIANLAKGELGEGPSYLLGALLATSFSQAAQARASIPEHERLDFNFYADEFQNFATDSFATILSEARKYRLSLTLAHQFLDQLPPLLRKAVFGNAGSMISFRIGAEDAVAVAPELGIVSPGALSDLPNYQARARLIQQGNPSDPFLLTTEVPTFQTGQSEFVIRRTRARYTRPRAKVEATINRFIANPLPHF